MTAPFRWRNSYRAGWYNGGSECGEFRCIDGLDEGCIGTGQAARYECVTHCIEHLDEAAERAGTYFRPNPVEFQMQFDLAGRSLADFIGCLAGSPVQLALE